MRDIDKELHRRIYNEMLKINPENIFSNRIQVFDIFEKAFEKISGNILDIGCGSGYAGIWLAKNRNISEVIALDASEKAIYELVPKNINYHKVQNIVKPRLGSFEEIKYDKYFDFVVSFGALHHSKCLLSTMNSISKSLKHGGYLIAQEPTMSDFTKNEEYIKKYNIIENYFGLSIRNGDRDDHFFREAEYLVSATFSGLDLLVFEDYKNKNSLKSIIHKSITDNFSRLKKDGFYLVFKHLLYRFTQKLFNTKYVSRYEDNPIKKYTKKVKPKILIFQKKDVDYIPHLWKKLY